MSDMQDPVVARIEANPKYQALKRKRGGFGWLLTLLMLLAYYGFIGLIAFDKEFLAKPIGAGVTTLGIPIAFGVIVFTPVERLRAEIGKSSRWPQLGRDSLPHVIG